MLGRVVFSTTGAQSSGKQIIIVSSYVGLFNFYCQWKVFVLMRLKKSQSSPYSVRSKHFSCDDEWYRCDFDWLSLDRYWKRICRIFGQTLFGETLKSDKCLFDYYYYRTFLYFFIHIGAFRRSMKWSFKCHPMNRRLIKRRLLSWQLPGEQT